MPTLISPDGKTAYIHFPKTGGWFISNILMESGWIPFDMSEGGHVGCGHLDGVDRTFGFVRHPVEWHRSLFNYLCNCGFNNGQDFSYLDSDNLEDFVIKASLGFSMVSIFRDLYGIGGDRECKCIMKYEEMHEGLADFFDGELREKFSRLSGQIVNGSDPDRDDTVTDLVRRTVYDSCQDIYKRFGYDR